ncbi:MAG: ABC transporter ATP-binding protein [Bacillota bacterium]|nr:ABC transporter ATP-binding protein [Bacillota bacterium]
MSGSRAYTVSDLTKVYMPSGTQANRGISLSIDQGEVFGIFGPNGAGKTTLVKQLAGLLKPTSGKIALFGNDVVAEPEIVPHFVAYYGQKVMALRAHKVREVILHSAVLRGMPVPDARRQTAELIERFGLGGIADQIMQRLSGGQQRQTALLATLTGNRPLLILDEPTNELDPANRRMVWEYLGQLNRDHGTTIILVTHNVLEAEQVVERVAIIDRGLAVAIGTPGELKANVDYTVRVEVRLKPGGDDAALAGLPGSTRIREGSFRITAAREQAQELLGMVLARTGLADLDDFRLVTPSLEDVYLRYTQAPSPAEMPAREAGGRS